jgi:hypothetical protein
MRRKRRRGKKRRFGWVSVVFITNSDKYLMNAK